MGILPDTKISGLNGQHIHTDGTTVVRNAIQ